MIAHDCFLLRWRVAGEFVVGFVGALYGDVVEEERGGQDGFWNFGGVIGDPEVFACGDYTGAECALV